MKNLYKGLTLLTIIPLLASCSSTESMDNKKALALVKGETYEGVDYKDYAHTKEKVLAVANHVKVTFKYDEKISDEEFAKYPTGKGEGEVVTNEEEYCSYKTTERIRRVGLDPLANVFVATYGKYFLHTESYEADLTALNAGYYVIAQSLLEDYEALRASDAVKDYPYSESTYYDNSTGELVVDYSLSYLKTVTMVVKEEYSVEGDEKAHYRPVESNQEVGFTMNVQATFSKEGAMKNISLLLASAHEHDDGNKDDKLDTFDYYIRASYSLEYSKAE